MRLGPVLAALLAFLAGAPPAGASSPPDGGTLRANSLVVPPSMRKERERKKPPALPDNLLLLGSPEVLSALGKFHPEIGAWAEYKVTARGEGTSRVLISVLPPPMPDGTFWLEIDAFAEGLLPAAMKVLTRDPPTDPASFRRVIVEVLGQNQIELPLSLMREAQDKPKSIPAGGAKVRSTPHVKLKVAAGQFITDKLQLVKGKDRYTIWRSSEVPLFGLVRSEGMGSVTELQASGHTGAHSLLDAPVAGENVPEADQGNGSDSKK